MEERRSSGRRQNEIDFTKCPRFDRYELTEDQIKLLAKDVFNEAKKEAALEVVERVIDSGGTILAWLLFLIGAAGVALAAWLHDLGIKF